MDAITRIGTTSNSQPDPGNSIPQNSLAVLESFIDHMVTAENNLTKTVQQAAIKNQEIQEEFEKQIAFLSGRLQEAQNALAAMEAPLSGSASPGGNELLNSKKGEVAYWRTRLQQVCSPDELKTGL